MFPLASILRKVMPAMLFAGLLQALPAHAQYSVPSQTNVYATPESGYISLQAYTSAQGEGNLAIYDNGNLVCEYYTSSTIACTEENPAPGTHTFIAYWGGSYSGDVYYEPSQSNPVEVTYP